MLSGLQRPHLVLLLVKPAGCEASVILGQAGWAWAGSCRPEHSQRWEWDLKVGYCHSNRSWWVCQPVACNSSWWGGASDEFILPSPSAILTNQTMVAAAKGGVQGSGGYLLFLHLHWQNYTKYFKMMFRLFKSKAVQKPAKNNTCKCCNKDKKKWRNKKRWTETEAKNVTETKWGDGRNQWEMKKVGSKAECLWNAYGEGQSYRSKWVLERWVRSSPGPSPPGFLVVLSGREPPTDLRKKALKVDSTQITGLKISSTALCAVEMIHTQILY